MEHYIIYIYIGGFLWQYIALCTTIYNVLQRKHNVHFWSKITEHYGTLPHIYGTLHGTLQTCHIVSNQLRYYVHLLLLQHRCCYVGIHIKTCYPETRRGTTTGFVFLHCTSLTYTLVLLWGATRNNNWYRVFMWYTTTWVAMDLNLYYNPENVSQARRGTTTGIFFWT